MDYDKVVTEINNIDPVSIILMGLNPREYFKIRSKDLLDRNEKIKLLELMTEYKEVLKIF